MTRKEIEALSEGEYCQKLDNYIKKITKLFYDGDNDNTLPCVMLIPHKYGIAMVRKYPNEIIEKISDPTERIKSFDLALPLTNALAHILDLEKANAKLSTMDRLRQATNDEVAYQVLTILLGEVLAGDRIEDELGLRKSKAMKRVIEQVNLMHAEEDGDDDDDEDEDEDEDEKACECGHCGEGIKIKKGGKVHHVTGVEMRLNDLEPEQLKKLIKLLGNDTISDEEKSSRLDKMLKEFGGKPVSKEKLRKFAEKIEDED